MKPVKDPERFEQKNLHKFVDFAKKHVLEIGSGDGRLTWKYASTAKQTIAFDPQRDELRLARADCPADLRDHLHLVNASASQIPLPNNTFDIAILSWSL